MSKLLNDKEIGLVKKYFDFDLSENELENFSHRLETDAAFAKEVESYEEAYNTIDEWIVGNRKDIANFTEGKETKKIAKAKPNPIRWAMAAMILLGFSIFGYYTFVNNNSQIDERVFAQVDEYTDQMTNDVLRGDTDLTTPIVDEEQRLKDIISTYVEENPAATIIALEDYVKSIKNPMNQELAEWWLVNIHLKDGNVSQAKIILEKITNNPNYNSSKKATGFLENL